MHLKPLRSLAIAVMLLLSAVALKAQNGTSETQYFVPQPFPRSPTATAFEKYGTYQVNEFTGIPDISIPLYTIEAGGFQVPITLSYHASGIKVTEVASWVGLGWSVSAGGQISRRVYGKPDDGPNGYLYGQMQTTTINPATLTGITYLEYASNGTYDTRPDIYSYDFPGGSGKFFFDGSAGNGTYPVRLIPYAPLKINYIMHQHFSIIDQQGNHYVYGDSATDSTTSSSGGGGSVTVQSAWKLESMISQNRRDTVLFSYTRNEINYPEADGETYTVLDVANNGGSPHVYTAYDLTPPPTPGNLNGTTEQDPATITFKNGKVVFVEDGSPRNDINVGAGGPAYGLNKIQVYAYNYGTKAMELQKTIVFYKSEFTNTDATTRLRLDSLQVLDKAGAVMQHYTFDYNTATPLPGYTSKAQDYWGYYNGVANSMLTPQQKIAYQTMPEQPVDTVTIGSSVANGRLCDSVHMQACMLTGIHYPTGGYSTFAYQTNRYDSLGTVWLAGGLRVTSISSYDGINPTPIVNTYVYNRARANFVLNTHYFVSTQTHRYWQLTLNGGPYLFATCQVRSFNSNPHNDLEGYDGAPVVYSSVTEYTGTPGANAGRTDYTFTDAQDELTDASNPGNLVYNSTFYQRGHLKTKKEFIAKSGGTYQPVKLTTNNYSALPLATYYNVGFSSYKSIYNEGPPGENPMYTGSGGDDTQAGTFTYNFYPISSDDNYLVSSTTNIYDTNDTTKYTTSSVSYTYDDTTHQQVIYTSHVDSKGNTHISQNKYPHTYLSGGTTHNVLLDSMISRHMYTDVVEKWNTLDNAATGVNGVVDGELTQYKSGSITGTIVPATISTLSVAQPLTNFTQSSIVSGALTADSRYVQMISFDYYDGQNNLLQYSPRNATPSAILWDHTFELPVAQVKNAPAYSSSITKYAYTSFEADSKGSWVYAGTPLYDATAPAGFYSYPLGAGAITTGVMDGTRSYVVSYWSNGSAATVTYNSTSYPATSLKTANGWTYYEHMLPAISGSSALNISGSVSIDELRLYPANAQMTTYNYDPSGVRSIADTKGANSYFEYDFLQRLKNVKDWESNIVKNYGYHMYNMTVGNQLQSQSFTRNNCPTGTTPGSLTYSVPANRYFGISQASANADAVYDMDTNGQIKANTNCGCPITTVTITLTNTTGLTGFQAVFNVGGVNTPYNFNSSSTPATVQVPIGTYTVTINDVNSSQHTYGITGYSPQTTFNASFPGVVVATGSPLTVSIQ